MAVNTSAILRDIAMPDDSPTNQSDSAAPASSSGDSPTLRILDASANRAAEGLRVIEDYLRFVLNDRHLTQLAKQLRHNLTTALAPVLPLARLTSRESQADVGATLPNPTHQNRATPADVAAASFKRLQQALRSLEEYGKLLTPPLDPQIESLRYQAYTLERAASITANAHHRLAHARLYVLVDGCQTEQIFTALIKKIVDAGVHVIQLRDKHLPDSQLLARARLLRELTRTTPTPQPNSAVMETAVQTAVETALQKPVVQTAAQSATRTPAPPTPSAPTPTLQTQAAQSPLFIMNDRPDLALLSQADGVHVGQDELSVNACRTIVGPHALIGVSTHSIDQARQAVLNGANYIGVGPTFPSTTKSFSAYTGLNLIRSVAEEISLPAFAIGGITLDNVSQVISSGIPRIAVSSSIVNTDDPASAVHEMLSRLAVEAAP